jgi:ribonuclease HII
MRFAGYMTKSNSTPFPDSSLEIGLYQHGIEVIAGLDEAGRGAWAGPVSAAAVVLPAPGSDLDGQLRGLHDSKQLSPNDREYWDLKIRKIACSVSVGQASVDEIDQIGILPATRLAMQRAIFSLNVIAEHLLIDYILIGDVGINQTAIPRGDSRALSIAAASVVAKVARDRLMTDLDLQYPQFGFAQHKGYGTRQHQAALKRLGPSPIHRRSFEPTQKAMR